MKTERKSTHPINPLILHRWSPRAMSGEKLAEEDLMALFEAARWAPSSYNGQPWRFLYAERESEDWNTFYELMGEFNQSWTKNAAALIVVISKKTFEHNGKPAKTHSFDTGAAWQNLALEASSRNIVAHGMEGFDYEKAKTDLQIPDDYQIEAMIAVGKHAGKEVLSSDLAARETPSDRKPLQKIIIKGKFKE